jgi:diguanylate cyclase (GGDEF)-like protein
MKGHIVLMASDDEIADILVVDDTPADCHFMAAILTAQGYRVRTASNAESALAELDLAMPDMILLDVNMPETDGLQLCRQIKRSTQFAGIPVIFISVVDDTESKVAAFNCGGIDYVTKPYRVAEIKARINAHLQMKRAQDRLGYQAGHDPLTGLPNRSLLADRLQQSISFADRYGGKVAVAYIDLDKFKTINDRLGHKAGDCLLVQAANRLQSCIRESDTIARIGGDEFVIVFYDQGNESVTAHALQRILDSVAEAILLDGYAINPTCSIGFACYPQDGRDVDTLLRNADTAMYRAKELGRNNFQFYTSELNERINERMALEKGLRRALEYSEFVLHYQPRIDLRSGRIIGLEALIRWGHPELGLLPPMHFIPAAEDAGLIKDIGDWVLHAVCMQHRSWGAQNILQVPIGVNISDQQFFSPGFAQSVAGVLREYGVAPSQLELDLKESLLMQDPAATIRVLRELKEIGVGLSIDDFGTGFSNLGYLKRFPVDRIKLDPSFLRDIQSHPDDLAMADAVIAMAHRLRMKVAAEGAESGSQLALLADRGCDEMQGDYFSPALPQGLCTELLRENRTMAVEKIGRRQGGRTLLLVDQEGLSGRALAGMPQCAGYRMLQAPDAHSAFDLLAAQEVGVIVCDQRVPDMSGIEFLRRVRQMYPQAVRIIVSDPSDSKVAADAINLGNVYKFLQKPCDENEFASVLDAAFMQYESDALSANAARLI